MKVGGGETPYAGPALAGSGRDRGVSFDAGFYEGVIEFNGEENFTRASATRAKGDVQLLLDALCVGAGGDIGSGPGLPGAELVARARRPRERVAFAAGKNDPGSRARLSASIEERQADMVVSRSVEAIGSAGSFSYDHRLHRASAAPPAPFSGSARFRRALGLADRWAGNLLVDFPGRSDVSLTDGKVQVGISRVRLAPIGRPPLLSRIL